MTRPLSTLAVTWNPAIALPQAVALALVFVAAALGLAWFASAAVRAKIRWPLIGLRALGVTLLAVLWLNPGRWLDESEITRRDWLVLLDRSGSMKAEHAEGTSRWQAGMRLADELRKASGARGEVHVRTFESRLEDEAGALAEAVPDGAGTDLGRAVSSALDERATALAGLIVISDGRPTVRAKLDELALRARGRGVPIHAVPLGGAWGSRDLALTAAPKQVTAFRGQPVKISARLENHGLGAVKPAVVLLGPDGKEIARQDATLDEGARQTLVFDLAEVPASGGDFTLRVAPWPGEHVLTNNADTVHVNVLASKTRVLLLEGAPYWDSKFLAQLLRQQNAVDILTVHRLNEERYFRVEAAGAEPLQSADSVFPASAIELARYDLIVFGKGADGFLTPARITALQGFVRDQGGAVLFARGKPYAGRFAALESLEPVEWGESIGGGFRFAPLPDAGANLFGAALPAADDRVWTSLPLLEDVHGVARLKPFARVLAEGAPEGHATRLPLLIVRRFGRGMVAAVNADGLWRWDFRPEVREQGAVYQQFWVQLMQWCATYSEFRPGQDYAVHLREATAEPGQPVRAVIAYRGPGAPEPQPFLKITGSGQPAGEAAATPLPGGEGGREWAAVITPGQPGRYEIRVLDKARPGREEGEATLTVLAPPGENDDLRPDAETLATLARESGGTVFPPEEIGALKAALWTAPEIATRSKPRFEALWPKWWVALLVGLVFGGEWWMRRREGLL
ncbi:MAG: hypothetical protein QOE70_2578 [Chthoniobacter sp.]|jgi:hypothetical protein|nr:hypothetical protein [Chthoniobacter sp.]